MEIEIGDVINIGRGKTMNLYRVEASVYRCEGCAGKGKPKICRMLPWCRIGGSHVKFVKITKREEARLLKEKAIIKEYKREF